MSDKAWKQAERKIAKKVGGIRTPLSGSASRQTSADVIHPVLYVEVKYRQRFAVLSLMKEVEGKARGEQRIPVVALQQRGERTRYYLIPEKLMTILLEHLPVALAFETSSALPLKESEPQNRQRRSRP